MDQRRVHMMAAAAAAAAAKAEREAVSAAAADTGEDNVPVAPNVQLHGIRDVGGDATDVPALPHCGKTLMSSEGNGAAPMGTDKGAVEGGGGRYVKCAKVFKSKMALCEHQSHTDEGRKRVSRPANAAAPATVGSKKAKKAPRKERWIADEEEEAAMILMQMSSVPIHRPPQYQMPGAEQAMLPDPVANAIMQPVVEDHVSVAVAGQHMREAAEPEQVDQAPEAEHSLRAEHVAKVTTEPQSPEVIKPEPETDAVPVALSDKHSGPADKPVSPGAKPKKRRLKDLERASVSPSPGATDVKPPPRRIPSPPSDRRYVCRIAECGRTFSTHQALGGHVARHNRDKGGGAQDVNELGVAAALNIHHHRHGVGEAASAGLAEQRRDSPPAAIAESQRQHRCSDCGKAFKTGQELGGHKRKHWRPAQATEAPPRSGLPRDFDLNELPRNEGVANTGLL